MAGANLRKPSFHTALRRDSVCILSRSSRLCLSETGNSGRIDTHILMDDSPVDNFEFWFKELAHLKEDTKRLGRLPLSGESGYEWLEKQRREAFLRAGRIEILDSELPGWRVGVGLQDNPEWDANLALLKTFHLEHGRFPRAGESQHEWLKTQRKIVPNQPKRLTTMNEQTPGWQAVDVKIARLEADVDFIRKFYEDFGRFPYLSDGAATFKVLTRVKKDFDRTSRALPHLPTPDENKRRARNDREWERTANEVADFMRTQLKAIPVGAPLSIWYNNQRAAARGGNHSSSLTEHRRAYLDEILPGWTNARLVLDELSITAIAAFIGEQRRWPTYGKGDKGRESLLAGRLARWRSKTPAEEIRPRLDTALPGWDQTPLPVIVSAPHVERELDFSVKQMPRTEWLTPVSQPSFSDLQI